MLTTEVENYPGFVDGILGPELMARFRDQAARFGAEFVTRKATRSTCRRGPFGCGPTSTRRRARRRAPRSLIVATGARSLMLGRAGREPACSATACRPAPPATGSSSATSRSSWSAAVTPRSKRRSSSPASPSSVTARPPAQGAAGVEDHAGPRLRQRQDRLPLGHASSPRSSGDGQGQRGGAAPTSSPARRTSSTASGVFVAIGHVPNTELFAGQLDMDEAGYISDHRRHPHQRRRRVRLRRRPGPRLPPGHHRGRVGLHGRHRRRALARGPGHGA